MVFGGVFFFFGFTAVVSALACERQRLDWWSYAGPVIFALLKTAFSESSLTLDGQSLKRLLCVVYFILWLFTCCLFKVRMLGRHVEYHVFVHYFSGFDWPVVLRTIYDRRFYHFCFL